MTIDQLLQLASNPYYVLSPKQVQQLEEYNKKLYEKKKNEVVKHRTGFDKHDTTLRKETDGEAN